MALVTVSQFRARQFGGVTPWGNRTTLPFTLETNASGAAINSDQSTGLAIADVVDLGPLPAGFRMDDSFAVISTGMSASVTAKLGFKYEDGIDSAAVPQDDAYFGTGLAMTTAARLRNATTKAVVTLPKPARLIMTMAGAANAKVSKTEIFIQGELLGK